MRRFLLTLDMIDKLCLRSFSKNVKKLSIKFQNLKVNKNKRIRTKELHTILGPYVLSGGPLIFTFSFFGLKKTSKVKFIK